MPARSTPPFTERDWRMLQLVADGWRYKDIAPEVGYKSASAAKNRFKVMFDAAGADNIACLVAYGFRQRKLT